MERLIALSAQMAREGIRRLLVISGEETWCQQQATALIAPQAALWVGDEQDAAQAADYCHPRALTTLLGREFSHAVFDARRGFDVAAFAALGGTLRAGGWLILLTPPFSRWAETPDADACRWSDTAQPIATPRFISHVCRMLRTHGEAILWQQGEPLTLPEFAVRPTWHPASGAPEQEQAAILAELHAMSPGVMVVTAPRGRGKSALAGMHLRHLHGNAIVTAPTRAATDVLAQFAGEEVNFVPPDTLLQRLADGDTPHPDWLIVDEAAAIPGPLLRRLIAGFNRVLLTTTVQGYEGTGQGFLLKLCAGLDRLQHHRLNTPLRWASGCPLEVFISDLLLFDDALPGSAPGADYAISSLTQDAWLTSPAQPAALYRLLTSAHYRTSPLDLRRMMDAPGQRFWQALAGEQPIAALWLVEEGGLSSELSQAVWAGFRRPRGNLVAQSLAAHGASPLAATLVGCRISRIAVHPSRQREGIGQRLIAKAHAHSAGYDYLSVSFGYTRELWRFWQRCGFQLVRLGSHREASSGCYTAMAILPLTPAAETLAATEQRRLARDLPWLAPWRDEKLPLPPGEPTTLNSDDWHELAGFAFAHRPLSAAIGALSRLLMHSTLPLAALRSQLEQSLNEAQACHRLRLAGRKALLAAQRHETAEALTSIDADRAAQSQRQIAQLQFF